MSTYIRKYRDGKELIGLIKPENLSEETIVYFQTLIQSRTVEEIFDSECDGIKTVFTLTNNAIVGTVEVFINGLRQRENVGFTQTETNEITLSEAPLVNFELAIKYLKI
jgi:hypothetical protein